MRYQARLVPLLVAGVKRIAPVLQERRQEPEKETASLLNHGLAQTTRCRTQKYWQGRRRCKKEANDFPFTNKDADRVGKGKEQKKQQSENEALATGSSVQLFGLNF